MLALEPCVELSVAAGCDVVEDCQNALLMHCFSLRMILSENRFPLFGIMRGATTMISTL